MDIKFHGVEYRYAAGTPFERLAITDITFHIPSGEYVAVIGHTGSGKSTVLQHLNVLLQPLRGKIEVGSRTIVAGRKEKNLKDVRRRVGIVFQFPEHQLFEETVEKDICFGPMNFGVSEEEARKRAREAIHLVGLPPSVLERSPFDLSGGQMRRVAIAGVLAMKPDVLVLDEPTAGLDPRGRREIMELFHSLKKENSLTCVLVTHSMEDAARYADRLIVMHKGRVAKMGTPRELFRNRASLTALGLDVPETVRLQYMFEEKLGQPLPHLCLTPEELAHEIARLRGERP
ncbi:energy-coupling factor ABC transporter ATP-binding protein [Domibacillus sp. DTU_2020_1001157_1_SI_ALB_TIR_016]|uniref:energy-coupling factor ABC transporter ATP-binding protein n=1 Tax=Domibacillus sp. DTU_2020_1001157_1_SI_ALB_TIR_016 TaxID=3077789 RepID=UPI0028EE5238|nr:energy-coupling factor ABC transporter ATP-binding protein [Domibacillus sp. DTU_2020_1001157_1_SI_ALB_TIR_016]WNS80727.1 energy-coupling factor ABC transporter ATP-binding protein [Domibacillus sp. DTU_2020_1001157_1_SI_ALB_TIR_016]